MFQHQPVLLQMMWLPRLPQKGPCWGVVVAKVGTRQFSRTSRRRGQTPPSVRTARGLGDVPFPEKAGLGDHAAGARPQGRSPETLLRGCPRSWAHEGSEALLGALPQNTMETIVRDSLWERSLGSLQRENISSKTFGLLGNGKNLADF